MNETSSYRDEVQAPIMVWMAIFFSSRNRCPDDESCDYGARS